jgi:hypothetical protein
LQHYQEQSRHDRSSNGGINALPTLEHQRRKSVYLISVGAATVTLKRKE